ncbi:MAG: hypothetical protein HFJ55_05605 [Clostridia bacterium]|nr:hypothetical protein [Clostridia bacterium]
MDFEKELRDSISKQRLELLDRGFQYIWCEKNLSPEDLRCHIINDIMDAYSIYIEEKMGNIPKEQLYKSLDEFEQQLSLEALCEMKEKLELEKQEEAYIKYQQQYNRFNNGRNNLSIRSINTKGFSTKTKYIFC